MKTQPQNALEYYEKLKAKKRLEDSAPELLAACKDAYSELNQLAFLYGNKLLDITLDKLKQAIAKAEGK